MEFLRSFSTGRSGMCRTDEEEKSSSSVAILVEFLASSLSLVSFLPIEFTSSLIQKIFQPSFFFVRGKE